MNASSPFLYPSVTSLPGSGAVSPNERGSARKDGVKGEFDQVFEKKIQEAQGTQDLPAMRAPVKFSAHATQRLQDRKITLDQATMGKLGEAIDKADAKGIEDTLVLTGDAALIVNVPNRTVVTAMDRESMRGNVFTKIDGAVWL